MRRVVLNAFVFVILNAFIFPARALSGEAATEALAYFVMPLDGAAAGAHADIGFRVAQTPIASPLSTSADDHNPLLDLGLRIHSGEPLAQSDFTVFGAPVEFDDAQFGLSWLTPEPSAAPE
ncbi:MAG: hypothetical protein NW215_03720 [Hyphomicrobiales bacterium]|nr:hypothetical protein [Hyphomicrobiales bacterium]